MTRTKRMIDRITIFRDDVYAGVGKLERGLIGYPGREGSEYTIVDCDAQLGADVDASEETYELIANAIDDGVASVERPDGTYTWIVETVQVQ